MRDKSHKCILDTKIKNFSPLSLYKIAALKCPETDPKVKNSLNIGLCFPPLSVSLFSSSASNPVYHYPSSIFLVSPTSIYSKASPLFPKRLI